ncbi:MAG: tRNA preQ1(34) S-adenosylmethionine ribosyltransferase-isomerase QueA [Candidatus Aminicenantes bacterium RBG_16_63_16]|nr:MAG: tRNA preQ1(34) S-adenosylmethionine ribosyltransferase-isomerase QueA [Candidatus Aminicenantes bacterium RBG_16_63_16]
MLISEFDYNLPRELIAQKPLVRRDDSRMMVVRRREGTIHHGQFTDLSGYLNGGDVLVINDTKVIPAKTWGVKDGKEIEFLFLKEAGPDIWEVLCRPAKKIRPKDRILFASGFKGEVVGSGAKGKRLLQFPGGKVHDFLHRIGFAPLPPYIKRARAEAGLRDYDLERYQTVFARREGSIAAPTAGLHFTPEALDGLEKKGAIVCPVTLDVGQATFQPIEVETVEAHRMLEERYEISADSADIINSAKSEGHPVVAVGTTVVRTLESAWSEAGVAPGRRSTSLFIHPGHEFKVVDRLLTNFHLPRSSLLMLVSAFAGVELIREAYALAVREKYRFFSYGDCMLII